MNFTEPLNFSECESDLRDPDYFSYRYRAIGTFFQGIVFIVGILGNAMVVLVVTRIRALHSPTNCYLVSLAIADSIVLLASVPNEILSYYLVGNQWVWGDVGCSLFIFFQNLGINASSLSLVAFTVERYIAICHPMTAHKMCTTGRAKKITIAVWSIATIYCSPWLALTVTRPLKYRGYPDARECVFRWPRNHYLIVFFMDLVMFYIIPLFLSCILYCLISKALVNRRVVSVKGKNDQTCHWIAPTLIQKRRGGYTKRIPCCVFIMACNFVRVVKMLFVVVVVFAVLWLPYRGMLVYNSFAVLFNGNPFMDLWFLMFAKTCVYINSAINPILYNAMSSKFRRAFHRLLICGKVSGTMERRAVTISTVAGRSTMNSTDIGPIDDQQDTHF